MASGLDTTFLVEAEVLEHPGHRQARTLLLELLDEKQPLALAPQVLAEFVHIVTDSRRFSAPLEMPRALDRARVWWHAAEVVQTFPTEHSTRLFLRWLREHRLGRKRLLDTQLAATYRCAGIKTIVSTNVRDFEVFGCFSVRQPQP